MFTWLTIGKDLLAWQLALGTAIYRKKDLELKRRIDDLIKIAHKLLDKLGYEDSSVAPVEPKEEVEVDTDVEQEETLDYDEM